MRGAAGGRFVRQVSMQKTIFPSRCAVLAQGILGDGGFCCGLCFVLFCLSEKELSLSNLCCADGGGGRIPNCRSDLILPNIRDKERKEGEEKPCSEAVGRRSPARLCPAFLRFQLSPTTSSRSKKPEKGSPGLSVSDPSEATPESLPRHPTPGRPARPQAAAAPTRPQALSPAARQRSPWAGGLCCWPHPAIKNSM